MSLRLPTRALVPVLVLAVLGGVVATFMVARPPSSGSEGTPNLVRPKLAKPAPVRKPAPARAKPAAKPSARKQAVKPAARPKPAAPAPVAKPAPVKPATPPTEELEPGLPRVVSAALADHRVVVVALYDPESPLDRIAIAEARAGAGAAKVGFVAINVFADAQSRPLVRLLGALENPGILVYRKPETLYARISGFADSETVAQAAANALR